MKLHLPKLLLTAVLAACVMSSQAWALSVSSGDSGTTVTNADGTWTETYTSVYTPASSSDFPTETVDAVIVASGKLGGDDHTYTSASNAQNIVVGGSGQLILQTWNKGAINLDSNLILGSNSNASTASLVLKEYSGAINLNGTVTLVEDTYVWMEGKTSNTVTFNEAVSGANYTLTTSCLKNTTFAADVTLGGLTTTKINADGENSSQINHMTFNGNVSIDSLNVESETTLIFSGQNKSVVIGQVSGSGILNTTIGEGVTFTLGSSLKTGTLTNNGTLVVEDWSGFEYAAAGGEDATENGLYEMTKTYKVLNGCTLDTSSISTTFTYGDQTYNIADGYTKVEGNIYAVVSDTVTVGGTEATEDTENADVFLVKGGTLKLAEGTLNNSVLNYTSGAIQIDSSATLTGLSATDDAAKIAAISGAGTMEVSVAADWSTTIATSEDFTGTVYVNGGSRFTYDSAGLGSILKLATGVDMQVNNGGSLTDTLQLESGNHEVHVNGSYAFDITGTVSGEGVFDKRGGSSTVYIKESASVENYLNTTGTTYVQGSATVESLTIEDGTVNVEGGSVTSLRTTGGTTNVSGGVVDSLDVRGGTVTLSGGSSDFLGVGQSGVVNVTGAYTTDQLRMSEQGVSTVTIKEGGNLTVTGATNDHSTNRTILLAHWGYNSTLLQESGELNATDAIMYMSWTGTGTYQATGGTANLKGISFYDQAYWGYSAKGQLLLGDETSGSARINIGASGISDVSGTSVVVKLGNGTLGATADWAMSMGEGQTGSEIQLIGTNGGTVFNTENANTPGTAHTITVANDVTGSGTLVKEGLGTLDIQGSVSSYTGDVEVSGGTLKLSKTDASVTVSSLTLNGGTLNVTGSLTLDALSIDLDSYTAGENVDLVTAAGGLALGDDVDLTQWQNVEVGSYTASVTKSDTGLSLEFKDIVTSKEITTTVSSFGGLTDGMLTLKVGADLADATSVLITGISDDIMKQILGDANLPEGGMVGITLVGTDDKAFVATADQVVGFQGNDGGVYYGEAGTVGWVYQAAYIPEPTTATLSLLALAGLAARRRRKA